MLGELRTTNLQRVPADAPRSRLARASVSRALAINPQRLRVSDATAASCSALADLRCPLRSEFEAWANIREDPGNLCCA